MSDQTTLVLCSERGLVFALARWLTGDIAHVCTFLRSIAWGVGAPTASPDLPSLVRLVEQASPEVLANMRAWAMVEPSFGQLGFGDPDLILVVEVVPNVRHAVFVEAKAVPYFKSACRWDDPKAQKAAGFNSTLNMQLALKYRLASALDGHAKKPLLKLVEPEPVFAWFRDRVGDKGAAWDGPAAPRHLMQETVLREIVHGLLGMVTPERCSFVAITDETGVKAAGRSPLHEPGFDDRLRLAQRRQKSDTHARFMPPPHGASSILGPAAAMTTTLLPFPDRCHHATGWIGWDELAAPTFEDPTGTLAPALRAVIGGMSRTPALGPQVATDAMTLTEQGWREEPGPWPKTQEDQLTGQLGAWSVTGSWKRNKLVLVKAVRLEDDRVAIGVSQAAVDAYTKLLGIGGIVARAGGKLPFAFVVFPWDRKGVDVMRWQQALTILEEALRGG